MMLKSLTLRDRCRSIGASRSRAFRSLCQYQPSTDQVSPHDEMIHDAADSDDATVVRTAHRIVLESTVTDLSPPAESLEDLTQTLLSRRKGA
jgi:hypothetical protein